MGRQALFGSGESGLSRSRFVYPVCWGLEGGLRRPTHIILGTLSVFCSGRSSPEEAALFPATLIVAAVHVITWSSCRSARVCPSQKSGRYVYTGNTMELSDRFVSISTHNSRVPGGCTPSEPGAPAAGSSRPLQARLREVASARNGLAPGRQSEGHPCLLGLRTEQTGGQRGRRGY